MINPKNNEPHTSIAVITNVTGASLRDLTAAAQNANVTFDQIKTTSIPLINFDESAFVKRLLDYDIVYYRAGLRDTLLESLADTLQKNGVTLINGTTLPGTHRKIQQALVCSQHNIPHPQSYIIPSKKYADAAAVLGEEFVIKPDVGSKGKNVILARSQADVDSMVSEESLTNKLIYQELIRDADEYRVYTLGDKSLMSYKKIPEEDFRANLHAGGTMIPTEKEREEMLYEFGSLVAKAFQADIAGIDVLVKDEKCYLLEVNYQPGWEQVEQLTGAKFCEETVRYIVSQIDRSHKHEGRPV